MACQAVVGLVITRRVPRHHRLESESLAAETNSIFKIKSNGEIMSFETIGFVKS